MNTLPSPRGASPGAFLGPKVGAALWGACLRQAGRCLGQAWGLGLGELRSPRLAQLEVKVQSTSETRASCHSPEQEPPDPLPRGVSGARGTPRVPHTPSTSGHIPRSHLVPNRSTAPGDTRCPGPKHRPRGLPPSRAARVAVPRSVRRYRGRETAPAVPRQPLPAATSPPRRGPKTECSRDSAPKTHRRWGTGAHPLALLRGRAQSTRCPWTPPGTPP